MSSSPLWRFKPERVNPIKLAHDPCRPGGRPIETSAFDRLNQYVSRAYCYTELVVSSLAVAETIASTHYAYPLRDGQAE